MRTLGQLSSSCHIGAHSWAQSDENVENCNSPYAKPNLTIQSCSSLIQSGKLLEKYLSMLSITEAALTRLRETTSSRFRISINR